MQPCKRPPTEAASKRAAWLSISADGDDDLCPNHNGGRALPCDHVRDLHAARMIGLSELSIRVSAVARGIAEAESVGIATSAQAATLTSNNRFIWEGLLGGPL